MQQIRLWFSNFKWCDKMPTFFTPHKNARQTFTEHNHTLINMNTQMDKHSHSHRKYLSRWLVSKRTFEIEIISSGKNSLLFKESKNKNWLCWKHSFYSLMEISANLTFPQSVNSFSNHNSYRMEFVLDLIKLRTFNFFVYRN